MTRPGLARFWALVVAVALVGVACGGDDDGGATGGEGGEQQTIELVAVHGSSPDFIALVPNAAWDILEERGIQVEQRYVEEGTIALQAIAQGEGQIATNIGVNVGLLAVEEGAPIVDVMATQRPTWALVARNEITSIEGLQGKTVGVHGDPSFTKALADFYDRENNLNMKQVIIPGSEVRAEALANDEIDASVIDLPDIIRLEAVYPGQFTVLETIGETLPKLIEQDIWMDERWVEENPETAQEVVKALVEGIRRLREDDEYALQLATELLPEEDEGVLRDVITAYQEREVWEPNGILNRETAQFTLDFFADIGEIEVDPQTVDLEKYFNFELLDAALEDLGRQ